MLFALVGAAASPILTAADLSDLTYTTTNGEVQISGCNFGATGDLEIPEVINNNPVTSIKQYAFYNRKGLTSVTFPNSVTLFGDQILRAANSIVSIPSLGGISSIPPYTFAACTSLEDIVLHNGITTIGNNAFLDCASLEVVRIPATVGVLGYSSFSGCISLKEVHFDGGPPDLEFPSNATFSGAVGAVALVSPEEVDAFGGVGAVWEGLLVTVKSTTYAEVVATEAPMLSESEALPEATPFNDGVENLLKYAFNMNLAGPDSHSLVPEGDSGLPSTRVVENAGQTYWQFQYIQRKFGGLVYFPEQSTDLTEGSFEPMSAAPQVVDIDSTWARATILEPYDSNVSPKSFGRVRVEQVEQAEELIERSATATPDQ